MPLFGKSLFETVLDGMAPEEPEEDEDIAVRRPRVVAHFLADTTFGEHPEERPLGAVYEDFAPPPVEPEPPRAPEPPVPPIWLDQLSEQDVAGELGLKSGMSRPEIRDRRRAFARSNHPDGVAEAFRDAATVRMTIANRLVEAALRKV